MKKLICATLSLTLLSACSSYEPDMDQEQRRRDANRAELRQVQGCPAVDMHRDYRNCVIETYYKNAPRPYQVKRMRSGQPVAIFSDYELPTTQKTIVTRTVEVTEQPVQKVIAQQTLPPVKKTVIVEEITPGGQPVKVEEKTWWETYQNGKPVPAPKPQCPCADPNEPCPQCVEK